MNPATIGGGLLANIKSKMTPMNITIALFAVTLIGVSVYYYHHYMNSNKNGYGDNSIQGTNAGGVQSGEEGDVEIMFFHADWCPHCKKAQPEWESFKQSTDGKNIDGYKISCVDVNCTNEDDAKTTEYINKFNIDSYPTVKLIKDGNTIDFESRITTSSLDSFLSTMLND